MSRAEDEHDLVFLDTEATSLRADRRAWEIGLIRRRPDGTEVERTWFVDWDDLDLGEADPASLRIGRFYGRHPQALRPGTAICPSERQVMREVETYLRGSVVVGAVPWFDTELLGNRMRWHDTAPSWHYHLIDVESLAAGALGLPQPWDFDAILTTFGLAYAEDARHTAIGDARMARDLYDAVMGAGRR